MVAIDESRDSRNYTRADMVAAVFGFARTIKYITIHWWGNYGQSYGVVRDYLINNTTPTSAHFVVEGGQAACIVSPADAAWHTGSARGNAESIGIECRPEGRDSDYQSIAELIAYIRSVYGDLPLVAHNYWTSTTCPGTYDLDRLDRMARAVAVPAKPATPTAPAKPVTQIPTAPRPKPTKRKTYGDNDLHWVVKKGDTVSKIARYYGVPERVQAIADYNGIKPDALIPGERIWIPGRLVWLIEAPDTIRSVAAYYGLDAGYLARINGLSGPDAEIYIGNTLIIKEA